MGLLIKKTFSENLDTSFLKNIPVETKVKTLRALLTCRFHACCHYIHHAGYIYHACCHCWLFHFSQNDDVIISDISLKSWEFFMEFGESFIVIVLQFACTFCSYCAWFKATICLVLFIFFTKWSFKNDCSHAWYFGCALVSLFLNFNLWYQKLKRWASKRLVLASW